MVVAAADGGHSAGLDTIAISCSVMGKCDSSLDDYLAGLWIGPVEPNLWPTRSPHLWGYVKNMFTFNQYQEEFTN
jgi:hypothetical protein